MWLLPDDPLLLLAFIADLVVCSVVVLRIRHKRQVRRRYIQNVLRNRHLAWVARQEAANRQRDAETARREQQQREQERAAVQQHAREIANNISDGLARIQRMHSVPAQWSCLRSPGQCPSRCGG